MFQPKYIDSALCLDIPFLYKETPLALPASKGLSGQKFGLGHFAVSDVGSFHEPFQQPMVNN